MNALRAQSSPFTGRSSEAPAPYSPLAFHRSISLRSAARPAASTFAHCEIVIRTGDRILRGLLVPILRPAVTLVDAIDGSGRGGLGSTGVA